MPAKVEALKQSLRDTARAICNTNGYNGVVILVLEENDIHGGTWNISPHDMREMACALINASYTAERESAAEDDDE